MSPKRAWPPFVSVVVAAHDEEACLPELITRLHDVLASIGRYEIIVVDDGSSDRTFELVERFAASSSAIRGVRLSRNEGHQVALLCGMARASGDVVITIDADLQHPPQHLTDMLAAWRDGADVVHMRRGPSGPRLLRDYAARVFYAIFNSVSPTLVQAGSTDFRLLDARCIPGLVAMPMSRRFLRAAVRRIGFQQAEITFEPAARHAGASSYTLRRLVQLGLAALVSVTHAVVVLPIVAGAGLVVTAAALYVGGPWGTALGLVAGLASVASSALAVAALGARSILVARIEEPAWFVAEEVGAPRAALASDGLAGRAVH